MAMKEKILVSLEKETVKRLREHLPCKKGALSEFIEEAIREKLEKSEGRTTKVDEHRCSSSNIGEEAMNIVLRLAEEGRSQVTRKELDVMLEAMGIMSAKKRCEIVRKMLRAQILKPVVVRGNIKIYSFNSPGGGIEIEGRW